MSRVFSLLSPDHSPAALSERGQWSAQSAHMMICALSGPQSGGLKRGQWSAQSAHMSLSAPANKANGCFQPQMLDKPSGAYYKTTLALAKDYTSPKGSK